MIADRHDPDPYTFSTDHLFYDLAVRQTFLPAAAAAAAVVDSIDR